MSEKKYVNPAFPHILHGGDYNPDQWIETPEIWDEDMRLMKLANCNEMSVGIFSWATLEPEEGVYDFSFLDTILDRVYAAGGRVVLATPSGARPAWLSKKYPEVLRVNADRTKNLHGRRHNHCYTSPVYREKTRTLNRLLAERYKNHPALVVWHVSNEYGGECHCDSCQKAFREWLKKKYYNDLDRLNHEYWSRFWSHTYTDWEQIESPSPLGETSTHGLNLDWKRFVTDQTVDFMKNEIEPLKRITPHIPVTTNMMGTYPGLDYWKFTDVVDVVSWDSYPAWHNPAGMGTIASTTAFAHDLNRSLKDRPFMLMESVPSATNWMERCKLKRPGAHILSSLQAVAHGADTVQYFQWRKSRGSSEKFHGAVVDHCGHENTRVFKEISDLGAILNQLDDVVGTATKAEVAIVFDWDTRWALEDSQGFIKNNKGYEDTCKQHYDAFWQMGINVDVINRSHDLNQYKLVVAPMMYMADESNIAAIETYVKNGGIFVTTYVCGYVNENDLCHLGGFPGGKLKDVFGVWAEEIDVLYPEDVNFALMDGKQYKIKDYCELIHPSTAQTLATYQQDFYAGQPCLTKNTYGNGAAYFIAFRDTGDFTKDFYRQLVTDYKIEPSLKTDLPKDVTAHTRENFVFIENYNETAVTLDLNETLEDVLNGGKGSTLELAPYGTAILKRTLINS